MIPVWRKGLKQRERAKFRCGQELVGEGLLLIIAVRATSLVGLAQSTQGALITRLIMRSILLVFLELALSGAS